MNGLTDLIEELDLDQFAGGRGCSFCTWVEKRPAEEQEKWTQAMLDRDYTRASLFRAAKRRGFPHGDSAIDGHREHTRNEIASKAIRVTGGKAKGADK